MFKNIFVSFVKYLKNANLKLEQILDKIKFVKSFKIRMAN